MQQQLGALPRRIRRVGKIEMFKINDPIVGSMYRLVDIDITKPFLLASVYLTIRSLYETYPTCFDITDQVPTIGSECTRTVWSVYGTGPLDTCMEGHIGIFFFFFNIFIVYLQISLIFQI